jgi:hypothetical protein
LTWSLAVLAGIAPRSFQSSRAMVDTYVTE